MPGMWACVFYLFYFACPVGFIFLGCLCWLCPVCGCLVLFYQVVSVLG